jgi:ParB family chromosome partitioning protein
MTTKAVVNQRLEIVYLPTSCLVKLPGNPRKDTNADAIKKLAYLIAVHGFQNPLQVFAEDGKHIILAGNHRFDAGMSLGIKEFPCLIYSGDRKAAMARAISDNKSADWTDFDFPLLKDMIIEIDDGEFDLDMTGISVDERNEIFGIVGTVDAPELKDGDRDPFIQMTFTLHDTQAEELNAAISKAKGEGGAQSGVNENSNGNALAFIAERFNRG